MRRREFIALFGCVAAAWPVAVHAQQPAKPVIGFLGIGTAAAWSSNVKGFLQGLDETGFNAQNMTIEFRWAEGDYSHLTRLAADLIDHKVSVIFAAGGSDPAKVAKAATGKIPIVFVSAADPVKAGLIESLSRPEGNVTGVSLLGSALEAKRLGLLHEIFPGTVPIGILVNPNYADANLQLRELQEAATAVGRDLSVARASTIFEIETGIANLSRQRVGALLITQDPFLNNQREQIAVLAARYKLPAIASLPEFAKVGGLAGYGTDFPDGFRLGGVYVGKILKGTNPSDLPVIQPTKFSFVINLKTAKALGLTIPQGLLNAADEVIE